MFVRLFVYSLIYHLCCYLAFNSQFVRGPLKKANCQARRVQASAWRARDKFQIYFYFGHFLLYSPFVMYRLFANWMCVGAAEQKAILPYP